MAFTTPTTGQRILASHVAQILNSWQGVASAGVPLENVTVSDSTKYAGDFRNQHANGYGLRVRDSSSNVLIQASANALQLGANAANDLLTINCNISGKVYLGDSANGDMTAGITINQGTNTDQILAFKGSDVAHGMTTRVETDTFGSIVKYGGAAGGLGIRGYGETTVGISIRGCIVTENTTKSTAGVGAVSIEGQTKSGTTTDDMGTNANIVVIKNNANARVIFDAEGDIHCDAGGGDGNSVITGSAVSGYNTYDSYDDIQLTRTLEVERNGQGLVREEFDKFLKYNRGDLENLKLASFENGGVFVNYTGLVRLHSGAIWQMAKRQAQLEERLQLAEAKLLEAR